MSLCFVSRHRQNLTGAPFDCWLSQTMGPGAKTHFTQCALHASLGSQPSLEDNRVLVECSFGGLGVLERCTLLWHNSKHGAGIEGTQQDGGSLVSIRDGGRAQLTRCVLRGGLDAEFAVLASEPSSVVSMRKCYVEGCGLFIHTGARLVASRVRLCMQDRLATTYSMDCTRSSDGCTRGESSSGTCTSGGASIDSSDGGSTATDISSDTSGGSCGGSTSSSSKGADSSRACGTGGGAGGSSGSVGMGGSSSSAADDVHPRPSAVSDQGPAKAHHCCDQPVPLRDPRLVGLTILRDASAKLTGCVIGGCEIGVQVRRGPPGQHSIPALCTSMTCTVAARSRVCGMMNHLCRRRQPSASCHTPSALPPNLYIPDPPTP